MSHRNNQSYKHLPTRHDLSQLHAGELEAGMVVRSLQLPKWIIEPIQDHVIDDLVQVNLSQIASGSEKDLPKKLVIKYARKPRWVMREL